MCSRVQSTVGIPSLICDLFSLAIYFLRKKSINNFIFPNWSYAASFNNNNNNNTASSWELTLRTVVVYLPLCVWPKKTLPFRLIAAHTRINCENLPCVDTDDGIVCVYTRYCLCPHKALSVSTRDKCWPLLLIGSAMSFGTTFCNFPFHAWYFSFDIQMLESLRESQRMFHYVTWSGSWGCRWAR